MIKRRNLDTDRQASRENTMWRPEVMLSQPKNYRWTLSRCLQGLLALPMP